MRSVNDDVRECQDALCRDGHTEQGFFELAVDFTVTWVQNI